MRVCTCGKKIAWRKPDWVHVDDGQVLCHPKDKKNKASAAPNVQPIDKSGKPT